MGNKDTTKSLGTADVVGTQSPSTQLLNCYDLTTKSGPDAVYLQPHAGSFTAYLILQVYYCMVLEQAGLVSPGRICTLGGLLMLVQTVLYLEK